MAKERLDQLGIGGQHLELFPLVGRIAHAQAEDQFQILPIEDLGLFKMGRSQPEGKTMGQAIYFSLSDGKTMGQATCDWLSVLHQPSNTFCSPVSCLT